MKYPEFLSKGGRIGFIAPSFGCTTEPYLSRFQKTLKRLQKKGYQTVLGPNCFAAEGVGKSNTPEKCGAEINQFFLEDLSDVIISCGGGETMCEDLPFVDFEAVKEAPPKWYMGFSDNTNLTFTLPTLCDTAAIYGPCAGSFGTKPMEIYAKDALKLLRGKKLEVTSYKKWEKESKRENPYAPGNYTEPLKIRLIPEGSKTVNFSGRLIGGCLDCIVTLCGTPYDKAKEFAQRYQEDGIIWFLEACDLNPMGIRRALWQLKQAGWFQHVKGFLIGRSLHYDDEILGVDRITAYTSVLEELGVPMILDADLGHLPPSMPLISGAMADVTASKGKGKETDWIQVAMRLE